MGRPPEDASEHELAHWRAGNGERLSGQKWWRDKDGNARVQHSVPYGKDGSRRAAVVQAAGYLSKGRGFADDDGDREWAKMLAKEAGVPLANIEREARAKGYVGGGTAAASGGCLIMTVWLVALVVTALTIVMWS